MDQADFLDSFEFTRAEGLDLGPPELHPGGSDPGPVVILANPRSGTTALSRALMTCNRFGTFYEGNHWGAMLLGLQELRRLQRDEPAVVFGASRTLSEGRLQWLQRDFARQIERMQRRFTFGARWLDKTITVKSMAVAPLMAQMFPNMRFIYITRNGVATCESHFHKFPWVREDPRSVFGIWSSFHARWRTRVRFQLGSRAICIQQEHLSHRAEEVVERLATFLEEPALGAPAVDFLTTKRVNSAFESRAPGDYHRRVEWTEEEKRLFQERCGEEMAFWGYSMEGLGIMSETKSEVEVLRSEVANLQALLEEERTSSERSQELLAQVAEKHGELRRWAESLEKANLHLKQRIAQHTEKGGAK